MIHQEQLEDVWRERNEKAKDYTYYSASKKSFSRLDMIWMSTQLSIYTNKIEILPRGISDHNPIIWMNKVKKTKQQQLETQGGYTVQK